MAAASVQTKNGAKILAVGFMRMLLVKQATQPSHALTFFNYAERDFHLADLYSETDSTFRWRTRQGLYGLQRKKLQQAQQ
jgi:hypothetical protein